MTSHSLCAKFLLMEITCAKVCDLQSVSGRGLSCINTSKRVHIIRVWGFVAISCNQGLFLIGNPQAKFTKPRFVHIIKGILYYSVQISPQKEKTKILWFRLSRNHCAGSCRFSWDKKDFSVNRIFLVDRIFISFGISRNPIKLLKK